MQLNHRFVIDHRTRTALLIVAGIITASLVPGPLTGEARASERDGFFFNAGLALGTYNPDLEPRRQADLLGSAFILDGFALSTEWQNKEYSSLPLKFHFDAGRWRIFTESEGIGISPAYITYGNYNNFDYEGRDASYSTLRETTFDPVVRSTGTSGLAVRLNGDDTKRRFRIFAGLRSYRVGYYYSSVAFNNADINQTVVSGGNTFALGGSVSEIETAFASSIEYSAQGAVYGLSHSEDLTDNLELRVRLGIYNLSGTARSNHQTLSIFNGSTTTTAQNGATSSASENEIHYNLRQDSAKLFVSGQELDLGLYYRTSDTLQVFARLSSAASKVRDSEVTVLLLTTNGDANPYTTEINGETVYSLTARYTYPGSVAPESVGGLVFGIEHQL